jgi:hypothetical protein
MLLKPFFRCGVRKVSDVQLCSHVALLGESTVETAWDYFPKGKASTTALDLKPTLGALFGSLHPAKTATAYLSRRSLVKFKVEQIIPAIIIAAAAAAR